MGHVQMLTCTKLEYVLWLSMLSLDASHPNMFRLYFTCLDIDIYKMQTCFYLYLYMFWIIMYNKISVEQKSLKFKNCLSVIERHNCRLLEKKHCELQIILNMFIKAKKKHCFNLNNLPNRQRWKSIQQQETDFDIAMSNIFPFFYPPANFARSQ